MYKYSMSLVFIQILLLSLFVNGHVRMFFSDSGGVDLGDRPIRNSGSPTADGEFSTAGPCGGATTWGGASTEQISDADPGDVVSMKIQYNGGHKSPENEFAVRWACGQPGNGPTEADMLAAEPLASGTCTVLSCPTPGAYPCPAVDGNDFAPGYIMSCPIPDSAANMDCSFSMLDQRDWGGCVDIQVSRNVDGFPVYTLSDHEGDFTYQQTGVSINSALFPGCCCTLSVGTFTVTLNDPDAILNGQYQFSCPDHSLMQAAQMMSFEGTIQNLAMVKESVDEFSWKGTTTVNGQAFEFVLRDQQLFYTNIDLLQPMICGGNIAIDSLGESAGTFTVADDCDASAQAYEFSDETGQFVQVAPLGGDSGAGVGAFPFIIVAILLVGCGVGYGAMYKKGEEKEENTFTMPPINN